MEDIHSILINVLSNIVWLPIGALLAYIGFFFSVRLPHRALWQVKDPANLVVCASSSTTTNTGVYNRPATGIGQVRALALALRSLHHAYHKHLDIRNILLSTDHLQERIENDLLILGSSKTNAVTARFLELLEDEQPAKVIDSLIIWRIHKAGGQWVDQGAVEYEGSAMKRQVVNDYGLIIRAYNPFTLRKRTAILFSGSHTYGTVAAAKFFTENMQGLLRKLTKDGRKNFVILVSTQVVEGYPTRMKVERSYAW
ncbi:hypothetical protein KSD_42260 [Ktedonobacter sp. SOSP1-85]|uniref:hypothetical protein n=1 Tax=unclassified Ktedonobacter TaxID=388461 RepID=UPI00191610A8|nr:MULTISPECIES: hypothetical protein [unclassified Ktedonobacter]GHO65552.1 hypothetical protein KSC_044440 [Ktedonobacter sp. SOSP1-52]GHO76455.1 hypothetical protein KSD_42260 [Ktedonobacter sp. SOSP1-85]